MNHYYATDIQCSKCWKVVKWRKENFIDPESGYHDWRLDIRCECGEVKHPDIRRQVYEIFRQISGRRIRMEQNEVLDRKLGTELHRFIEERIARYQPVSL